MSAVTARAAAPDATAVPTVAAHPHVSPRARAPRPTVRRRRRRRRPRTHPTRARITSSSSRASSTARTRTAAWLARSKPPDGSSSPSSRSRATCGTRRSWAVTSRRCSTPSKPRFDRSARRTTPTARQTRDATSASWDTAPADGSRGCGWATRHVNGKVYGGAPRVKTLLTLGTPHATPSRSTRRTSPGATRRRREDGFERFECRGGAEGARGCRGCRGCRGRAPGVDTQRARTSSLSLTNFLYPGGVGRAGGSLRLRARRRRRRRVHRRRRRLPHPRHPRRLRHLGTLGEVAACVGAGVSYRTATGGDSAPGDSPPGVLQRRRGRAG